MKTSEITFPITIPLVNNQDDLLIMEEILQEKGFKEGEDYELHIAMGDDYPHAATFHNLPSYLLGKHYKGISTY